MAKIDNVIKGLEILTHYIVKGKESYNIHGFHDVICVLCDTEPGAGATLDLSALGWHRDEAGEFGGRMVWYTHT